MDSAHTSEITRSESRIDLYLLSLHALFFGGAFPPIPMGYLAWIAFVPYFFFLDRNRGRPNFWTNYLLGFFTNIIIVYWIAWNSGANRLVVIGTMFGAVMILAVWYMVYGWAQSYLAGRWGHRAFWAAPFLWTGVEYFRSHDSLAFPWTAAANTQTYYLRLIQVASGTGMWGISFIVLTVNVLIFMAIRSLKSPRKAGAYAAAAISMLVVPWIYGYTVLEGADRHLADAYAEVRVSLVQSNIDPLQKWDRKLRDRNFEIYKELTAEAAKFNPELIVWPETATPTYLRRNYSGRLDQVLGFIDSAGAPLLTGTLDYALNSKGENDIFNSAFLLRPGSREILSYAKMHLVPFSERVPFEDSLPFLNYLDLGQADFTPGDAHVLFPLREGDSAYDFGVQICFESVFPDLVRQFVDKGARFLVIITNDAWFGYTSGPFQHARIAVFRAIENRRSIARCANTGVSELIDPYGRITGRMSLGQRGVINGTLKLLSTETFYTKHGDYVGWFTLGASVLLLIGTAFYPRKMK